MYQAILLASQGNDTVGAFIRRLQERIEIDLTDLCVGGALNVAILCITGPKLEPDVEAQYYDCLRADKKILPVLLTDDAALPSLLADIKPAEYNKNPAKALDGVVAAVKRYC